MPKTNCWMFADDKWRIIFVFLFLLALTGFWLVLWVESRNGENLNFRRVVNFYCDQRERGGALIVSNKHDSTQCVIRGTFSTELWMKCGYKSGEHFQKTDHVNVNIVRREDITDKVLAVNNFQVNATTPELTINLKGSPAISRKFEITLEGSTKIECQIPNHRSSDGTLLKFDTELAASDVAKRGMTFCEYEEKQSLRNFGVYDYRLQNPVRDWMGSQTCVFKLTDEQTRFRPYHTFNVEKREMEPNVLVYQVVEYNDVTLVVKQTLGPLYTNPYVYEDKSHFLKRVPDDASENVKKEFEVLRRYFIVYLQRPDRKHKYMWLRFFGTSRVKCNVTPQVVDKSKQTKEVKITPPQNEDQWSEGYLNHYGLDVTSMTKVYEREFQTTEYLYCDHILVEEEALDSYIYPNTMEMGKVSCRRSKSGTYEKMNFDNSWRNVISNNHDRPKGYYESPSTKTIVLIDQDDDSKSVFLHQIGSPARTSLVTGITYPPFRMSVLVMKNEELGVGVFGERECKIEGSIDVNEKFLSTSVTWGWNLQQTCKQNLITTAKPDVMPYLRDYYSVGSAGQWCSSPIELDLPRSLAYHNAWNLKASFTSLLFYTIREPTQDVQVHRDATGMHVPDIWAMQMFRHDESDSNNVEWNPERPTGELLGYIKSITGPPADHEVDGYIRLILVDEFVVIQKPVSGLDTIAVSEVDLTPSDYSDLYDW